ncbi:MAG TPA: endo alpha-1,4 polygalactosaminidase [Kofleriaceae bacterium]
MGRRDEPGLPRLRTGARVIAAAAAVLAGCGGGHSNQPDAGGDAAIDAPPPPPWWQPQVGEAKNWDIQLSGTIDVSTPRLMYDLDLWALVPSPTTLDYGDGTPVTVPAGALAGTIAQLHARTPRTFVICHVETGALEANRPDAKKFPSGVTGGPVPGLAMGRFLDVSLAGRAKWASIMFKRFDLAKQIGCDGVEPAHNDVASYTSGLTISSEDSYSWYAEVATQGHARELSVGMKDGDLLGGQVDAEADRFDWLMTERCGEFELCDNARPFIERHKPVFAIDYNFDSGDDSVVPPIPPRPQGSTIVCMRQGLAMIADGLYKDVALTKAVRTQCEP